MTSDRSVGWLVARRSAVALLVTGLVWCAAFALVFLSPVGRPVVEVQISSSTPGFSQLFFADADQLYSEERSARQPVASGDNTLLFPLKSWRGTVGTHMRWDPLDQPGDMVVRTAALASWGLREDIPLVDIKPSVGMGEIIETDEGALLSLQSNDPQALIEVSSEAFYRQSLDRAVILSSVAAMLAAIVSSAVLLGRLVSRRRFHVPVGDTRGSAHTPSQGTNRSGGPTVPIWALLMSAAVALISMGILVAGSQRIGVSWDEPGHEVALTEYFRSGWFVPPYLFVNGIPDTLAATVYAPVGWIVTHGFGVLTGSHAWSNVPLTEDAYGVRHLATALLALVGLFAAALIVRLTLGSWRWAVLCAAMVGALPLYIGHGMFNTKDVAVASGFTLFTLGLVVFLESRDAKGKWFRGGVAVVAGAVLAIGTRPGIWIALATSTGITLLLVFLLRARIEGLKSAISSLFGLALSIVSCVIVGFTILWLIYPVAFSRPFDLLRSSLGASQSFDWSGETLTAGSLMTAQPPWTYIPLWLGAQLPILIMVTSVIGLGAVAIAFVRSLTTRNADTSLGSMGIPIALQAISVPLGALVLGATLYGGLRQLLFIFPAIAALGTIGLYLLASASVRTRHRSLVPVLWIVVVVGIALPVFAQLRLFPYSFIYFNVAAASRDVNGNWELDGWWLSARELLGGSSAAARTVCAESPPRPIVECASLGVIAPFLENPSSAIDPKSGNRYQLLTRFESSLTRDDCRQLDEVSRPLYWQDVQLSSVQECKVSLSDYAISGISLAGVERPDKQLLWGWNQYLLWGWGVPDGSGVWTASSEATLGFVAPLVGESAPGIRTLAITGRFNDEGIGGSSVDVSVNGERVGEIAPVGSVEPHTWFFSLPAGVTHDRGNREVLVRFAGLDDVGIDSPIDGVGKRFRLDSVELR